MQRPIKPPIQGIRWNSLAYKKAVSELEILKDPIEPTKSISLFKKSNQWAKPKITRL